MTQVQGAGSATGGRVAVHQHVSTTLVRNEGPALPLVTASGLEVPDYEQLEAMSPSALLQFGGDMTTHFDAQVEDAMNSMYETIADSDALSAQREMLQALSAEMLEADSDENASHALSPEQLAQLEKAGLLDELGIAPGATKASLSPNVIERADSQLQARQSRLNSEQEQRMLFLQETMRQRSQLAQLLSNLLHDRGETMAGIVRNMA